MKNLFILFTFAYSLTSSATFIKQSFEKQDDNKIKLKIKHSWSETKEGHECIDRGAGAFMGFWSQYREVASWNCYEDYGDHRYFWRNGQCVEERPCYEYKKYHYQVKKKKNWKIKIVFKGESKYNSIGQKYQLEFDVIKECISSITPAPTKLECRMATYNE